MNLDRVTEGANAPHEINVIIEIPAFSAPVKYEIDKETGAMFVDRFLDIPLTYPCNYGYIPNTLALDGDPLDVLVITPYPLISGSVITCNPIKMLDMKDENGPDSKILAVPTRNLGSIKEISDDALKQIRYFFEHYKDLDPNKWVKIFGWKNLDETLEEICNSLKRFAHHENVVL